MSKQSNADVKLLKVNDIDLDVLDSKNSHSHHHFKHKGKVRCIDFILAAKNDDDEEKKNIRKFYFHNLKRKILKISSPKLSQVD